MEQNIGQCRKQMCVKAIDESEHCCWALLLSCQVKYLCVFASKLQIGAQRLVAVLNIQLLFVARNGPQWPADGYVVVAQRLSLISATRRMRNIRLCMRCAVCVFVFIMCL